MQQYNFKQRRKEISNLVSVGNLASNRDKGNDARVPEELEVVMIAHYDEKTNKVCFKQELIKDLI